MNWDDFQKKFKKQEEPKVDVDTIINSMYQKLEEDVIRVELGSDLVPYIDDILSICSDFRLETFLKSGFILPPVRFLESTFLQENEYKVFVQGAIFKDEFAVFNKNGVMSEFAKLFNTIFDEKLDEIFTNEMTERYLRKVDEKNYLLAKEITAFYDMHDIKQIFINILQNKKSIKNVAYIVEKVCAANTENINRNNYDRMFYRPISVERIAKMICE